jgi:pSer/pThr/pTyr-binding forkhead associated (FHA) protein
MLEARRSRALLSRDQMELGKVPTTPTTAAVIAGLQVQEAIKYLHGLETIAGRGFHFDGTYVNGIPVMRQVLKSGDQIVLGKTVLEFVLKEAN